MKPRVVALREPLHEEMLGLLATCVLHPRPVLHAARAMARAADAVQSAIVTLEPQLTPLRDEKKDHAVPSEDLSKTIRQAIKQVREIASDCVRLRSIAPDCVRLHSIAFDCVRLRPIAFDCVRLRLEVRPSAPDCARHSDERHAFLQGMLLEMPQLVPSLVSIVHAAEHAPDAMEPLIQQQLTGWAERCYTQVVAALVAA